MGSNTTNGTFINSPALVKFDPVAKLLEEQALNFFLVLIFLCKLF